MGRDKIKTYAIIVKSIGQILALSKLYNQEHPVVKTKTNEVFNQVVGLITETEPLVFSESPEATLLVNGEEVRAGDGLMKRFIQDFRNLKLGSLDLKYGITLEEFSILIDLLNNPQRLTGNYQIKEYLKNKGVVHLDPSFAAYKLVNENEVVIGEDNVVQISDIPKDKIDAFVQHLCAGKLDKEDCKQDKVYSLLAHDSSFLYKVIMDNAGHLASQEDFIKTLWIIGDYLIDEIDSARQEELNHKIINELKEQLLNRAGAEKIYQEGSKKALVAINAALQLKGLILLYKKHKKGLENSEKKINRILNSLPKDSLLYIKAKKELAEP